MHLRAEIKASEKKDGITSLVLEFDPASDGWFLYAHTSPDTPPILEFWHMSMEDAMEQAAHDWTVLSSDWSGNSGTDHNNDNHRTPTLDANGTPLQNGDTVTVIKDLDVKGAGQTIKRGTTVKNISLTDDPELIDCRTKDIKGLVLKSCFVKKI